MKETDLNGTQLSPKQWLNHESGTAQAVAIIPPCLLYWIFPLMSQTSHISVELQVLAKVGLQRTLTEVSHLRKGAESHSTCNEAVSRAPIITNSRGDGPSNSCSRKNPGSAWGWWEKQRKWLVLSGRSVSAAGWKRMLAAQNIHTCCLPGLSKLLILIHAAIWHYCICLRNCIL